MNFNTKFTELLNVPYPIIMAPMFLVSNIEMVKAAMKSGIVGTFPTLNYRKEGELEAVLDELNIFIETEKPSGNYGVNLIVQKSNPLYEKQLKICIEKKVPFYITSLGNPGEVIELGKSYGAVVFCDVTNIAHAKKVVSQGANGLIAVGQGAGGHAGPNPLQIIIPSLKKEFPQLPIIGAGGVADGSGLISVLSLGADGVSMGTRFIASQEASVVEGYKQAIVDSKMTDIILTERLSGTPSAIINTAYAKKIGTRQNFFERTLSKNSRTKKYFKMLVQLRGMKKLEKSVKPGSYNNLWGAGQSVELINDILPVSQIVINLVNQSNKAFQDLKNCVSI
jgi:nitronate monooxygenase